MSRKKQVQIDLVRDYYKAKKVVESVRTVDQLLVVKKYVRLYDRLYRRKLEEAGFSKQRCKEEVSYRVRMLRSIIGDIQWKLSKH